MNEFCPPNSSDDLCLCFCIYPSSISKGLERKKERAQIWSIPGFAAHFADGSLLSADGTHGIVLTQDPVVHSLVATK